MRSTLLAALVALVALAAPSLARAEARPRVAVLEIIIEGDAPAELRNQLDRSLAGGLYAAGFEVIPRDEVAAKLKSAPELVGCNTTTCLSRVAEMVGTRQFVRVRVSANGAAYTFEVELLSADDAAGPLRRVERSCPVCTLDEANEMMSTAAAALGEDAPPPTPTHAVRIVTRPPGAQVEIDGERVADVTPMDLQLTAGAHTVRVILTGRAPGEHKLTVAAQAGGEPQVFTLALGPAVDAGGHATAGTKYGNLKWAAAGGAAVTLVAGIWLLSVDGDPLDCPDGPPGTQCANLYDTATGGTLLTLTGVLLGGAAGYLFYKDGPREQGGAKVGAKVTPGSGVQAWVGWDF